LWRNVIPYLQEHGRCLAPDLIGMGDSAKLTDSGAGSYRFVEHRRYLDGLLELLGVRERVTLVVHDYRSGLGFDWANRHRDAVAGIAYMEAIVAPVTWSDWPDSARGIFQAFRSEAGENIILDKNAFVENVLPAAVLRTLGEDEMDAYRAPFRNPGEDRRPTTSPAACSGGSRATARAPRARRRSGPGQPVPPQAPATSRSCRHFTTGSRRGEVAEDLVGAGAPVPAPVVIGRLPVPHDPWRDAGCRALIGLDRGNRRVVVLLARVGGLSPGDDSGAGPGAGRAEPRPPGPPGGLVRQPASDVVPLDRVDAVGVGRLLATSATSDVVDAHVVSVLGGPARPW